MEDRNPAEQRHRYNSILQWELCWEKKIYVGQCKTGGSRFSLLFILFRVGVLHLSTPAGFYFCRPSLRLFLFFSVGWQWGRRDAIRDATRARPSREHFSSSVVLRCVRVRCKSHVAILYSRTKCVNILKRLRISNADHKSVFLFSIIARKIDYL